MNALIYKQSLRNGLILAGISTVLTIVFYLIDPMMEYTNVWISLIVLVVMITLLVILGQDIRRKVGGFWNFGQAYLGLIIISVVVLVIGIVVNFAIIKFINPGLPAKINDATLETTTRMLEKFGATQDQIDDKTKPFTNGEFLATQQPTVLNELKNLGKALLIYGIIDLIIAACIKKNKPMFAPVEESDNTVV